jgi:hypothetical protein
MTAMGDDLDKLLNEPVRVGGRVSGDDAREILDRLDAERALDETPEAELQLSRVMLGDWPNISRAFGVKVAALYRRAEVARLTEIAAQNPALAAEAEALCRGWDAATV